MSREEKVIGVDHQFLTLREIRSKKIQRDESAHDFRRHLLSSRPEGRGGDCKKPT